MSMPIQCFECRKIFEVRGVNDYMKRVVVKTTDSIKGTGNPSGEYPPGQIIEKLCCPDCYVEKLVKTE